MLSDSVLQSRLEFVILLLVDLLHGLVFVFQLHNFVQGVLQMNLFVGLLGLGPPL